MNKLKNILCSLAILATVSGASYAEESKGPALEGKREHRRFHGPDFEKLAEHLNLTEEQKAKIEPLRKAEKAQLDALRDDKTLSREARRAKVQEIHQATMAQIRPLLTPEQQAKLDKGREKMKERFKERRGEREDKE